MRLPHNRAIDFNSPPEIGELMWADILDDNERPELRKKRPVVIISYWQVADGMVMVIPCSSREPPLVVPSYKVAKRIDGRTLWIRFDHVAVIPMSRLTPDENEIQKLDAVDILAIKRLVLQRQDVNSDIATHDLTRQDIAALAYRKKELKHFERLLSDETFFAEQGEQTGKRDEALWQAFFERNPWIFGYGLRYAFMTGLDDRNLEQVVKGFDVAGPGKRADAVLKTHAHLSSLAFVEIKRHSVDLLARRQYRAGVWAPSEDVAGGVAQCHEVLRAAGHALGERLRPTDESGNPTGEDVFQVHPRTFLVVGRLSEFESNHGPNAAKFRSFETFRRNLHQPEIVTYDELLFRARFIVGSQEHAASR